MKERKLWKIHAVAVLGFIALGVLALGSATTPPEAWVSEPTMAGWSQHPLLPMKDYVVVGTVVLRNTTTATVLVDLMDRAVAMGGHDVMNVRFTREFCEETGSSIINATAVVIRFTDETILWLEGTPISVGDRFMFNGELVQEDEPLVADNASPRRRVWPWVVGSTLALGLGGLLLGGF